MTSPADRTKIAIDISAAVSQGAHNGAACKLVGLSVRTLQRWGKDNSCDKRPNTLKTASNALTQQEKDEIIAICNSDEFKDMSPNVIVPILAQRDRYIASEATYYRVLKEYGLLHHRSETKAPQARKAPSQLLATGPDEVWSWDITYLKTSIRGSYFYLYLFMDVWSRKITGWTVETLEDGEVAAKLVRTLCERHGIKGLRLHSDNGSPMKCGTMLATLQWLGVAPSFSRPGVSNDNPFSESLFKTMKYRPAYPKEFTTIEEARVWVESFVAWYNMEHHHSGISYVTPQERHAGDDVAILEKRNETYRLAQMRRPDRWSKGTRNWNHIKEVALNRKTEKIETQKCA